MRTQFIFSAILLTSLSFSAHAYIADGSEVLNDNERITQNARDISKLEAKIRELETKLQNVEANQNKIIKLQYESQQTLDKQYSEQAPELEKKDK